MGSEKFNHYHQFASMDASKTGCQKVASYPV